MATNTRQNRTNALIPWNLQVRFEAAGEGKKPMSKKDCDLFGMLTDERRGSKIAGGRESEDREVRGERGNDREICGFHGAGGMQGQNNNSELFLPDVRPRRIQIMIKADRIEL